MSEQLAINGGQPVREEKIYYGRQWIEEDDIRAVEEVLKSDFITCQDVQDVIDAVKKVVVYYRK